MKNIGITVAIAFAIILIAFNVKAQTVYKCVEKGKTSYSNEPCIDAKEVDTTPTRGLNKSSGVERIGKSERTQQEREILQEGLRPIFGETAEQYQARHRRTKLSNNDKKRCYKLDSELENAKKGSSNITKEKLYKLRYEYRELRC